MKFVYLIHKLCYELTSFQWLEYQYAKLVVLVWFSLIAGGQTATQAAESRHLAATSSQAWPIPLFNSFAETSCNLFDLGLGLHEYCARFA